MRSLVGTPLYVLGKAQHYPIFPVSGTRVTPVPGSHFLQEALQGSKLWLHTDQCCGESLNGNVRVPARVRIWLQGEQNLLPVYQGNVG